MPDGASPRRWVLVVDDDLDTRATTADALGDRYHVVTAATVGAIVTLFVLMQVTGRVKWDEVILPGLPQRQPGQ